MPHTDHAPTHAAAEVVLINTFEVPEDQIDAAIAGWTAARDFLSEQPGYVGTALHRALAPNARFGLINVARWRSPADFQVAIAKMQAAHVFPDIPGLVYTPGLYRVIAEDRADAA
ncbi:MAG: antibiotic biosynthesis monooxygenase [Rhodospirillaceae bacterium]|nr:antibiotic biosynthesis monooxygenase [Rhodospirillaceae bacterium]